LGDELLDLGGLLVGGLAAATGLAAVAGDVAVSSQEYGVGVAEPGKDR